MMVAKLSVVTGDGFPLQMSLQVSGAVPSSVDALATLQLTAVLTAAVAFELGSCCAEAAPDTRTATSAARIGLLISDLLLRWMTAGNATRSTHRTLRWPPCR